MRKNLQPFLLTAALIGSITGHDASAQDDFHQFSNKNGQKIEAKIVSVTPDWKTMKIQRRDGKDFEMAVNVLSLDDQQMIKGWIKANPNGAKIDFNLDVEIEKKAKTTSTNRSSYYKYKTMDVTYEIDIKNRTREDLTGARCDYVVILEDAVSFYRDSNGQLDYSGGSFGSDEEGDIKYLRKSEKLPEALATNHSHTFLTEAVQHHQMFGDGNVSYGEDKILGVVLRVISATDEVIGEYRSSEAYIQKVTWDQVKGRGFGSNAAGTGRSDRGIPEPTPAMPVSSEIPGWLEVRELETWPELLQKGDSVQSRNMPKWGQQTVRISAYVDIDDDNTGGVIVACGGSSKGFSLFVLNDALHFWSRKAYDNNQTRKESISVPLSEIPTGDFKVAAEYTDSTLKLWIDDALIAEGPSIGLITYRPQEGISVGFDSDNSSVGPAESPHPFRGSIRDVQVRFGN